MLNHIVLMGRLTADPELRRTNTGNAVTSFSLAVDRDYSSDGVKLTDFFSCVSWRNTAEFIAKYFTKGRAMVVSGQLQTRSYQDRQGTKRTVTEILVSNAYFADSKTSQDSPSSNQPNRPLDFQPLTEDDDDIPF